MPSVQRKMTLDVVQWQDSRTAREKARLRLRVEHGPPRPKSSGRSASLRHHGICTIALPKMRDPTHCSQSIRSLGEGVDRSPVGQASHSSFCPDSHVNRYFGRTSIKKSGYMYVRYAHHICRSGWWSSAHELQVVAGGMFHWTQISALCSAQILP